MPFQSFCRGGVISGGEYLQTSYLIDSFVIDSLMKIELRYAPDFVGSWIEGRILETGKDCVLVWAGFTS